MQESIYDPGFATFGGGSTSSIIHPLVIAAVVLVAALTFTLKRKYVIVPLMLGFLLVPYGQNWYIGGFHVFVQRVLIVIGWSRLLLSRTADSEQFLPGGLNVLDKVFLVWASYRALATVLLFGQLAAFFNQVGFLWDALGAYFLFRALIEDEETIARVVKVFAVVAVIAAAGMIYEHLKAQNLFAFLGAVRPAPETREGRIRAQAFFGHPLLAGAYGGTTFCLFLWLWKQGKGRVLAALGMIASPIMAFAASSSTPIMSLLGGLFALSLWPLRNHMRVLRWGMAILAVGLQVVMRAPIWFLIGRIDLSGGSTGYHRAMLIDNFVRHLGSWWLVGTHDYVNWGYDMWDQANQYILEGENGGLIAFACFIALFCICYSWTGNARKAVEGDKQKEWKYWILGAALFAQTLAFIGVDYFDQTKNVWYMLLVIVTVGTHYSIDTARRDLAGVKPPTVTIRKPWERLPSGEDLPAPQKLKWVRRKAN